MPGVPVFEIQWWLEKMPSSDFTAVIPIGSEIWCPLGVTGPPKDENYT